MLVYESKQTLRLCLTHSAPVLFPLFKPMSDNDLSH